ncbi:MAG: SPFH domain-containing protein [Gemmataceae bacterium]
MRWLTGFGVLLLAGYLLTGVVQVRPGERAVVRRFGRVLDEKPASGLWVGLPWGMDRVDRVEVDAVRSLEVGYDPEGEERDAPPGQLLTGDDNLVNVRLTLNYKVVPDEVADFVVQGERVTAALARLAEAAAAEWAASRAVDDVLLRGKPSLRAEVIGRVRAGLAGLRMGVEVLDARVSLVAPPDDVKDAFESVARAQTAITTERHRAEQEAATRRRMMRAEAYRVRQTAESTAHGRRVAAKQEADRFVARLGQYRAAADNPDYLRQLWQEERAKLFAKLKERGQIDLLDRRLSEGGLDVITGR